MSSAQVWLPLDPPAALTATERRLYRRLSRLLANGEAADDPRARERAFAACGITNLYNKPTLAAAAHVLFDLYTQGWQLRLDQHGTLASPAARRADIADEKGRIRAQELVSRNAQLSSPSVRRFLREMETPRLHEGGLLSIYSLMRDGRELADSLEACDFSSDPRKLAEVVRPYIQIVNNQTCELTGFRTTDIWRYFRHTWSNAYATTPGRTMQILIRDAARPFHPVVGLAAIASPVMQIAERDSWIGWDADTLLAEWDANPTTEAASWLLARNRQHVTEIYVDDLLRDSVLRPGELLRPQPSLIDRLRLDAERHRLRHHSQVAPRVMKPKLEAQRDWVARAETALFRSKRSLALASCLESHLVLSELLGRRPSSGGLRRALSDASGRRHIRQILRRAKGERVGTILADLSVCGALPPYSGLVAGKLVAALAVSPTVLSAYRDRYARPSEIASSMAGRPVVRDSRLAYVGTTSLYGTGSSQYNRLRWPASVMGGDRSEVLGFELIGKSRSFGTSQFSPGTVEALVRVAALHGSSIRVNGVFGEGVSPRLRKVRLGLAALGWPANELLQHGRSRLLYGVPLVRNLQAFAIGLDPEPVYLLDVQRPSSDDPIREWWYERWAAQRAARREVRISMRATSLAHPVTHGARPQVPEEPDS